MKRILSLILMAIFFTGMLTSIQPAKAQTKQEIKPIELTFNTPLPPVHTRWTQALAIWCKELEKRTGGRVKVTPYFSETLSPLKDCYDSVVKGMADFGESWFGSKPGQFPILETILSCNSPHILMKNPTKAIMELYKTFPAIREELKQTKVLCLHGGTPLANAATTKRVVRNISDLKGLKLNITRNSLVMEKWKALGVSVVNLAMGDVYMGLQRGVLDGTHANYEILIGRRWGELVKHATFVLNDGYPTFFFVMNLDKWNKLPRDIQNIIEELSGDYLTEFFGNYWWNKEQSSRQQWEREMGGRSYSLSKEELEQVNRLVNPIIEDYVSKMEAKGVRIREIYKKLHEIEKTLAVSF